jgi:hypothetical protein
VRSRSNGRGGRDGGRLNPKIGTCEAHSSAELREIEPGEKYALDITVGPPWPNDKLRGSVVVETGLQEAPQESIRYFGGVDAGLSAEPKTPALPTGEERQTELRRGWCGPAHRVRSWAL